MRQHTYSLCVQTTRNHTAKLLPTGLWGQKEWLLSLLVVWTHFRYHTWRKNTGKHAPRTRTHREKAWVVVNCSREWQNKREYSFKQNKKAEVIPPRVEEPKLLPTAEAKGFPNPAPRGAWVPKAERQRMLYSSSCSLCAWLKWNSSILLSYFKSL